MICSFSFENGIISKECKRRRLQNVVCFLSNINKTFAIENNHKNCIHIFLPNDKISPDAIVECIIEMINGFLWIYHLFKLNYDNTHITTYSI